jgi:hypothetical protein
LEKLKADGLGATEIAKRLKIGRASDYRVVSAENGAMERVFIGATRVEATRKRMMGIQKARAEVAALAERDQISAQLDRSAVTIRFDDEDSGAECRWGDRSTPTSPRSPFVMKL